MPAKITRRDFLKGCTVTVGGIAALAIGAEVITPLVSREKMEFDQNTSPWVSAQPAKNPPLQENIDLDVAIIGGGYTGLSAAYYLKQHFPEKDIAVFEARGVGQGASGRNGGMILPQTANEYMQVYSNPKTHKLIYDVTVQNFADLTELVKAQSIDCDLKRNGVLLVVAKENQVEKYRQYAEQARSLGIPVEFWDKKRTTDEIGTEVYYASLYDPNGGEVHPIKLVHALKKAAATAGAQIYEDSPVLEIQEGKIINLLVGEQRHRVRAQAVVLATNGYTSKLGYFKNSVLAIHTPMAVTSPLPESIFSEIGWNNKVAFSDTYNLLYHLSITPDQRILIGSGSVSYFFNNSLVCREDVSTMKSSLLHELVRIYPRLSGIDFENLWTGVLGFTLDFSQSVGVMGEYKNIYYGLAYAGHGVNLSTLFGKIISDLYAGEGEKWKNMPFLNHHFIPLPPEPLKWVSVQANIAYYRMMDALE
jgi:glycine/D-amino acid oxidase-like deaminating enzyme